jgi:dienelactone hydrolase
MSGRPCSDCISGSLSDQTYTGEITTIHGLQTYVARPEGTPKGLVVIIPDAFGWDLVNNRVLADKFAKSGEFLVYLPDFMNGKLSSRNFTIAILHTFFFLHGSRQIIYGTYLRYLCLCRPSANIFAGTSISGWYLGMMDRLRTPGLYSNLLKPFRFFRAMLRFVPFMIFNRRSVAEPRIFSFFKSLRSDPVTASMSIGAAGYCWGGKYAVLLSHDTPDSRVVRANEPGGTPKRLTDVAFTAHPSWLKVPDDIHAVSLPLKIAVGDVDHAFPIQKVQEAKAILEKKKDGQHELVIFPGALHGFAVRSNPKNEDQVKMGQEAADQAVSWFEKWLS